MAHAAYAVTYAIDTEQSITDFEVPHVIGFSSGIVKFKDGKIDFDEKASALQSLDLTLDSASITTYNEDRDAAMQSEQFLNTAAFPTISVRSKKVDAKKLSADVTVRSTTKLVSFEYVVGGTGKDENGKELLAVFLYGKFNKKDFGIEYNVMDESGKPMLGDEIHVLLKLVGKK